MTRLILQIDDAKQATCNAINDTCGFKENYTVLIHVQHANRSVEYFAASSLVGCRIDPRSTLGRAHWSRFTGRVDSDIRDFTRLYEWICGNGFHICPAQCKLRPGYMLHTSTMSETLCARCRSVLTSTVQLHNDFGSQLASISNPDSKMV